MDPGWHHVVPVTESRAIPTIVCQNNNVSKKFVRNQTEVAGIRSPVFNGEFDPGSGRTLAACLTHASRAVRLLREYTRGERVRNTRTVCPTLWNNLRKRRLIPDIPQVSHEATGIAPAVRDEFAAYQLVGEVKAHQGIDG